VSRRREQVCGDNGSREVALIDGFESLLYMGTQLLDVISHCYRKQKDPSHSPILKASDLDHRSISPAL